MTPAWTPSTRSINASTLQPQLRRRGRSACSCPAAASAVPLPPQHRSQLQQQALAGEAADAQPAAVPACSRRAALLLPAGLALLSSSATALAAPLHARAAEEEEAAGAATEAVAGAAAAVPEGYVAYTSPAQGYSLARPASWEQVSKMGADVLFEDPGQRSTSVGVTVLPVTISSLEEFGDLAAVGRRLLDAERAKDGTKSVRMLASQQRTNAGGSGGSIYYFQYLLDSTRGTKQIFSTVTVAGRKLYIVNGNLKCTQPVGGIGDPVCGSGAAEVLQRVAASFRVD